MARVDVRSPWDAVVAEAGIGSLIGQLYWSEPRLLQTLTIFVNSGLDDGDALLLVMTPEHQNELLRRMAHDPLRIEEPERPGQLAFVDAERLVEEILVDGVPVRELFETRLRSRIATARQRSASGKVRIFGETLDLLWRTDLDAAVCLAEIWHQLAVHEPVAILCAYRMAPKEGGLQPDFPEQLANLHSHLIPV